MVFLDDFVMLFQLSDSIVSYAPQDEEKVLFSVARILDSFRDGCIYLTASVLVCQFFKLKFKEERLLKTLNFIDQNRALLPSVLWRINIVLVNPDYSKYEVGLSYFEKSDCLLIPFFVSENVNDIEFYSLITEAYYPEASLCYIPAMGGGSTTSKVISEIRRFGFILAIVDSDRKYRGATLGDTASNCNKTIRHNNTFAFLKVLDIHEVENLIPLSSIRKVQMNRESRNFFRKILSVKYFDFLPFYDYKEGISVSDMDNSLYRVYAEDVYAHLYSKNKMEFSKYINQCKKRTLRIFPGFRKDLLDDYLKRLRSDKSEGFKEILGYDCFECTRRSIANLVFTFCCARGTTPIN